MSFILSCDYDNTIVFDEFPGHGDFKEDIVNKIKEFKKHGAELILWTCREGENLEGAVSNCKKAGLEFDSVNENTPSTKKWLSGEKQPLSRKVHADFYLDDKASNLDIFLKIDVAATCKNFENRKKR